MGTADKVCCTFTTYNVLGTIFGLLVVAVASWLAADKISFFTELKLLEREENGDVSEQFSNISVVDHGAFILIAIGVAIVIQSVLGCTGTMMGCCRSKGARTFLIVYAVLIALVIICEIVAAVLVLNVYRDEIGEKAQRFMETTIREDYKISSNQEGPENSVTILWDSIMTSLQCCGVNGYKDFSNGEVPDACCLTPNVGNSTMTPSPCPDLSTGASLPEQMTQGCFPILIRGSVPAIASSLAVVALFQIAGVILSCFLSRRVEESREWYEMRSM